MADFRLLIGTLLMLLRSFVAMSATASSEENPSPQKNAEHLLPHLHPGSVHRYSDGTSEIARNFAQSSGMSSSISDSTRGSDDVEYNRRDVATVLSSSLRHILDLQDVPKVGQESGSGEAEGETEGSEVAMAVASVTGRSGKQTMYTDGDDAVAVETICPASCFMPDPVCGTDGLTYWCGSVDAECSGVEVEHAGYCRIGNVGTGSKAPLAMQSLLLVHMLWLVLAAGLVLFGVP